MLTTFLSILSLNNPDLNLCFLLNRRPVYNPQYSADYPDFSPKKRKLQSPPDQNSKVLIINDHAAVKKTERELRATLWPRNNSSFDFTHILVYGDTDILDTVQRWDLVTTLVLRIYLFLPSGDILAISNWLLSIAWLGTPIYAFCFTGCSSWKPFRIQWTQKWSSQKIIRNTGDVCVHQNYSYIMSLVQ